MLGHTVRKTEDSLPKLSHRAIQQALAFLRELYILRSWDDLTTHVITALPTLIPTDICSYNDMSSRRRYAAYRAWPDGHPTIPHDQEILGRYAHQHPIITYGERTKDLSARKITDFVSQREFRKTALYNEFYRPLQLPYNMGAGIALTPDSVIAIGFNRIKRDFDEQSLAMLDLLRPHLVQAYGNAERVTAMQDELSALNHAIEELDRAVLSLTPQGGIQWATPGAYRLITKYRLGLRHASERLSAPLLDWVRHTMAQLDAPADLPTPLEPFVLSLHNHTLTIRLIRDRSSRLLLLDERCETPAPEMLAHLGLSRRETEILSWVVQGKTNVEIGIILGISPRTVQTHLKRIYRTLGVENRHAAMTIAMDALRNPGRRGGGRP